MALLTDVVISLRLHSSCIRACGERNRDSGLSQASDYEPSGVSTHQEGNQKTGDSLTWTVMEQQEGHLKSEKRVNHDKPWSIRKTSVVALWNTSSAPRSKTRPIQIWLPHSRRVSEKIPYLVFKLFADISVKEWWTGFRKRNDSLLVTWW